ncbi:hypothetical protein [Haloarchaeobius sp. HRN-SO-5]|uniref:hypothetical protein n=1 Tax=Haloarchaeobius sp. HRN-SO-5 TaxID=3446118 RepID=UPI003EBB5168
MPDRLRRTGRALLLVTRRQDALAVGAVATLLYLVVYLVATGDVALRGGLGVGLVTVVEDPLSRLFERTGPFAWEPIALVDLGVARWLVSPLNVAVGGLLALLVGTNLAVTYLAWRYPQACGIERSRGTGSGVLAALPALLSGSACCGPVVLLAVGVSASGALLTMFEWLLPIGVALLLGSLVYTGSGLQPSTGGASGPSA